MSGEHSTSDTIHLWFGRKGYKKDKNLKTAGLALLLASDGVAGKQ